MASFSEPAAPSPDEWLVVETQYPTTYGCNRGRRWSRLDLIRQSDVSIHGPFADEAAAADDAKARAASECRFDGHADFEAVFGSGPDFDSADAENWDNDEEVRFEVMTRARHVARVEDDRKHASLATAKLRFKALLRDKVLSAQVRSAGRVYYCWRREQVLMEQHAWGILFEWGDRVP